MLYLKKCVVFQFLEFESDSDHMESIYYPALTLEEDVILEIQINGPPGPEHKKTFQRKVGLLTTSVVINVQDFSAPQIS